jgi:hypothetical protein
MSDTPGLHVTDIKQSKQSEPDGNGGFHDVVHIAFTTPSGSRSHVKIPHSHYSKENAAAAIHHEVSIVESVHDLADRPLVVPNVTPAAQG